MKTETKFSTSVDLETRINYGKLPVLQLTGRIASDGDTKAKRELHDNREINYPDHKRSYHIAEYIEMLKNNEIAKQWCGHTPLVLEEAYNLTIDKFNNIPARTDDEQQEHRGPNCQLYFLTYFVYTTALLKEKPPTNALEAEMISLEMLRRFIDRQFYFSCLEAKRKEYADFIRRYRWRLPGGDLYLWLPWNIIPSQRCRIWLEENVPDVDPRRPGEKERVQAIIDRLLAKRKLYFLSELYHVEEKPPPSPDPLTSMMEEQVTVDGLAETVADEKAQNIEQQRRTIQVLGKDKLKELIRTVFTRLADGKYVEKDIAGSFGLSPATLSRFAGSHWKRRCDDTDASSVPDLWHNVAQTLAGHSKFVMVARKAGVLKRVYDMLKPSR